MNNPKHHHTAAQRIPGLYPRRQFRGNVTLFLQNATEPPKSHNPIALAISAWFATVS